MCDFNSLTVESVRNRLGRVVVCGIDRSAPGEHRRQQQGKHVGLNVDCRGWYARWACLFLTSSGQTRKAGIRKGKPNG
jgi:hypothetical protein